MPEKKIVRNQTIKLHNIGTRLIPPPQNTPPGGEKRRGSWLHTHGRKAVYIFINMKPELTSFFLQEGATDPKRV